MEVVIIDDEINAVEHLKEKIEEYGRMRIAACFNDSREGLSYLLRNPCDLLFLDIDMPNINGIYIAEQITSLYPRTKICFITAYDGYAIRAFELNAIDYFLKPYSDERLKRCLDKLCQNPIENNAIRQLSDSYHYDLDMICCFNDENIMLVASSDIFYIEVIDGVCYIHTRNQTLKGNKTLNFYEEKLKKKSFFRTHKCYLANLTKVERFSPRINYTYDMFFREIPDSIPVSRSKVKELKKYFNS